MRVIVILEHRFFQTSDGRVWTDGPFPHSFFARYLDVFEEAVVAARAEPSVDPLPTWQRADGDGVRFACTPNYVGAWQHLIRRAKVACSLRTTLDAHPDAAVILRIPSEVASLAAPMLRAAGRPFAAEVVADPYDAWSPGSYQHPLRPYIRQRQSSELRRLCRAACATAFVTAAALQRRYPPRAGAPTTHYSSVELPDEAFAEAPWAQAGGGPLQIVSVGSLEHLYKGQDVLLDAVALCCDRGVDLEAKLIGEGRYRGRLEDQRARLGLTDRVKLPGALPSGAAVRAALDAADLFVLPSRQEGLPRALLEAMARGLPAISTPVGGIPEVLPASDMARTGDALSLANLIEGHARSPAIREAAAARNLKRARDFHNDALRARRRELFQTLAAITRARAFRDPLVSVGRQAGG